MFNEGEYICVSPNQFANKSIPASSLLEESVKLISNNLDYRPKLVKTSDLILMAVNPMMPDATRHDQNVAKYRSILVELDTGSIEAQLKTIKKYGIPVSAQVFSGSKSIHSVITLEEDLTSEKEYRRIAKWIFNIITWADKNCINPTRGIRLPDAIRPETDKKQELISFNSRIANKKLMAWLNQYPEQEPKVRERPKPTGNDDYGRLSIWARSMLKKGIEFKNGRNKTWFALAYDFAKAGFDIDKATEILLSKFVEEHDFLEKELLFTIASAYKTVEGSKS